MVREDWSMKKKKLYMIGNSHIDPVWFWNWEEGMQEVKATYASALERMREFADFKFTSTSTAFFEWIEGILPEMFEEIKQRVAEGRWEITGGWFIEPDCILPCGEAFVRHGLYGQRYLQSRFGKMARIGSNVDSFGHNPVLPQILKKSGMDSYVFMRPRLDTPVFTWESSDGSRVNAICLPAEYTTWFHEPTVRNVELTIERTKEHDRMVCCYGVGNHGGGPTIENINTIHALQESMEKVTLAFAGYGEFLRDIDGEQLPLLTGPFEQINQGCYSIDSLFKQKNRQAEKRLMEADILMSMASDICGGVFMKETEEMERLWKVILFNEFHDTMGGTVIKSARDEAIMQISGVCARAGEIKALAIQHMVNAQDTRSRGFPLFLFHTGSMPYEDYVEVELEWFCLSPLKLLDPEGREVPYQRIHTDAKVRHTTLGGRRRFVFHASIPACGFARYQVVKEEPALESTPHMEILDPEAFRLENDCLLAEFDKATGMLSSLVDKETGYNALTAPASLRLYLDERDAWGGLQGRRYEDLHVDFRLDSIEKVESGDLREVIRVRLSYEDTKLEQLYFLGKKEKELRVENRLRFNHTWHLMKFAYPVGEAAVETRAEAAYGMVSRTICDNVEYNMQRFLDVSGRAGCGLAIANDGKYAFNMEEGRVQITVARSAIYAQGNSPDWWNQHETYEYTDIGTQTFRLVLKPHGGVLPAGELHRIADKISGGYDYLGDSAHASSGRGRQVEGRFSLGSVAAENVAIMLVKKAEDDGDFVLRLLETEGRDTRTQLLFRGRAYAITMGHYEIATYKISGDGSRIRKTDLLELTEVERGKG